MNTPGQGAVGQSAEEIRDADPGLRQRRRARGRGRRPEPAGARPRAGLLETPPAAVTEKLTVWEESQTPRNGLTVRNTKYHGKHS